MSLNVLQVLTNPTSTPEDKLKAIEELTISRLKFIIKAKEVPSELDYIVTEVTLKRYNRLGSEGLKQYTQEGLTEIFSENDFAEFQDEIDDWLQDNDQTGSKGVWRFH